MAGLLTEIAREWAAEKPVTRFSCGIEAWAYVHRLAGLPAPALPAHGTRRELVDLLKPRGGLIEYARSLMLSIGWEETDTPERGDVGIIVLPYIGRTCAICLGDKWMVRGERLVLITPASAVAAWRKSKTWATRSPL